MQTGHNTSVSDVGPSSLYFIFFTALPIRVISFPHERTTTEEVISERYYTSNNYSFFERQKTAAGWRWRSRWSIITSVESGGPHLKLQWTRLPACGRPKVCTWSFSSVDLVSYLHCFLSSSPCSNPIACSPCQQPHPDLHPFSHNIQLAATPYIHSISCKKSAL